MAVQQVQEPHDHPNNASCENNTEILENLNAGKNADAENAAVISINKTNPKAENKKNTSQTTAKSPPPKALRPILLRHWFYPQNWMVMLGYCLIRLVLLLPYATLMHMGARLGEWGHRLAKQRRGITLINIQRCFPQLSAQQQRELVLRNFQRMGQSFFEIALAYWGSDRKLAPLVEIQGVEHAQRWHQSHALIILGAHFTVSDLSLRLAHLKLGEQFDVVCRPHNNVVLEYLINRGRLRYCARTIYKNNVRGLLKSIREKRVVCYAFDQDFSHTSVFVPFFGIQTATTYATSMLAKSTDTKIVPCFCYAKPNNQGYRIEFWPALEGFPSGDLTADTARLNQILERAVAKQPEQYLWAHRRFKHRPPGEPDFYAKKLLRQ